MTQKQNGAFRIPPQSIEAEKALLGSIMLRPEALYDIMDFLRHESFYAEKHRIIFRSILDLFEKHEPIDLLSLSNRLKEKSFLESIGGSSYLAELVNTVPSSANAKHYADTVQKKHVLRSLIDASNRVSEMGYNEAEELDFTLDKCEKEIFAVTSMTSNQKFYSIKETLDGAWERLDRLNKSAEELRGVRTGFHKLDNKLAGFQKSDLIILAGRPSTGKTAFALDIIRQSALQHSTPICIFSLEMSAQQLVDRMLSAESRVDSWKIRTGAKNITDDEFSQIRDALARLSKAPIFIDDQAGNNIIKMRSTARRIKSEHGLGLIVVDYLQLMAPSRASDNMVQQVTEISRGLKQLARELDVPVLALSQLSRAVEQRGGKPRLSDLRDSGSIEQDADVVMFIHREQNDDGAGKKQTTEILIEKHRNGPTGKIDLYFDSEKTTFLDLEENVSVPAGMGMARKDDFDGF
jgi:replicative DNA helicase